MKFYSNIWRSQISRWQAYGNTPLYLCLFFAFRFLCYAFCWSLILLLIRLHLSSYRSVSPYPSLPSQLLHHRPEIRLQVQDLYWRPPKRHELWYAWESFLQTATLVKDKLCNLISESLRVEGKFELSSYKVMRGSQTYKVEAISVKNPSLFCSVECDGSNKGNPECSGKEKLCCSNIVPIIQGLPLYLDLRWIVIEDLIHPCAPLSSNSLPHLELAFASLAKHTLSNEASQKQSSDRRCTTESDIKILDKNEACYFTTN